MEINEFSYNLPDTSFRNKILKKFTNEFVFLNHKKVCKSLCLRNIDYIEIGNNNNQVLLAGAFHGMEWLTSLILIHFIKKISYCICNKTFLSDINISEILKYKGVIIIPCVNPDGVEISLNGAKSSGKYQNLVSKISHDNTDSWQANARGVDLNHNFNAGWEHLHRLEISSGISSPSITQYGGPHPESEPESKGIADLCRNSNIRHALAFHSQGEEIYWSYGEHTPKRSELMAKIFSMSCGYKYTSPTGLAVGGGFKDWFIEEFKRPAFTVEIGKGKNPLPLSDLQKIYSQLEELLILSIIM